MVAGYHLIWTAYGWWLPNDPRGSSSREIRVERIGNLGDLHHGRKRDQPVSCDLWRFYERAGGLLKHELLSMNKVEIELIAGSFARTISTRRYTCYACAIMSDHAHLLIRKHRDKAEVMIKHLQDASREAMIRSGFRPADHPVWGGPGWKVFLSTQADMWRIVKYIRDNPVNAGQPRQYWDFVTAYDGWLPGNPFRGAR